MSFFTLNFDSYFFYSIIPELFLIAYVLLLILTAVTTKPADKGLLIPLFLESCSYLFVTLIFYFLFLLSSNLFPTDLTVFFCYNTLKLTQFLIYIKILLLVLALGSIITIKRYLMLYQIVGYEYPLIIVLSVVAMFFSISANNWIILFLSLELQALCFLVLFAWNRRSEKAINATLKFTVINFIASTLIILAFIEIILYTQTFNMYLANPIFLFKNIINYFYVKGSLFDPYFLVWGVINSMESLEYHYFFDLKILFGNGFFDTHAKDGVFIINYFWYVIDNPGYLFQHVTQTGFVYNPVWQFVGFLIVVGFAMKLGLVPFGFWLQDLYMSVSLPVLMFFATAPKITYVTILISLYINLFSFVNPEAFLYPLLILGTLTVVLANLMMFTIRNNLLNLLAWSSIANMGLLFLIFGKYPLQGYLLTYIIYYVVGTLLFFLALQYFVILDASGVVRHPMYFTDLTVVRTHTHYKPLFILLVFSFLNFFGIPPLLGFWMKFAIFQGLVVNLHSFGDWSFIVSLVMITIIGGFSYIRVLYTLLTENTNLGLSLIYWPDTQTDVIVIFTSFVVIQIASFLFFDTFLSIFHVSTLLMDNCIVIK